MRTKTCTGHKCSTHTVRAKGHGGSARTVKLTRQFRGRRLTKSTKITIRVTKRGWIGKVFVFSMKHPSTPAVACLPPGSTKPVGC